MGESTDRKGFFCHMPFEYAQVDHGGNVFFCCPPMLPTCGGNLSTSSLEEVWNSEIAQKVRHSILDGSYKYCDRSTCGLLQSGSLPRYEDLVDPAHRNIVDSALVRMPVGPKTINLSYDRTCNLACPSCRSESVAIKGKQLELATAWHKKVLGPHLKDARRLMVTGSGDPFASKMYLNFLRTFKSEEHPDLRIHISTNGLLLTPKMWESICNESIDHVDVSIDACSPATYRVNRGGDYDVLLSNLRFLSDLRQRGDLDILQIHYVVQENNYLEMKDFVRLGLQNNCDLICFKQLQDWRTYPKGEYECRAIQLPQHAKHEKFLEILRDPIFKHERVWMHDLHDSLMVEPLLARRSLNILLERDAGSDP